MTGDSLAVESVAAPPCRNCGAPAPGTFCPACGQETQSRLPKFTQFMREAAGRYVALDGRLWKTLVALLFRPGFLTREYLAGRRRRYIRPARLFLVTSLLLFAILRISVELLDVDVAGLNPKEKAAAAKSGPAGTAEIVAMVKAAKEAEEAKKSSGAAAQEKSAEKDGDRESGLRIDDDINLDLPVEIPTLRKRIEHFNRLSSQQKEAQIVDGIFRYGPYAMFVLLPAFALLLKILYLGRGRRYPTRPRLYSEHLVFAAHNTAFVSLGIIAAMLSAFGPLRAVVIVWIVVYLVWSTRVVYRGSWLGLAARAFVVFIVYSILFGFVTAGLVITAVVLR